MDVKCLESLKKLKRSSTKNWNEFQTVSFAKRDRLDFKGTKHNYCSSSWRMNDGVITNRSLQFMISQMGDIVFQFILNWSLIFFLILKLLNYPLVLAYVPLVLWFVIVQPSQLGDIRTGTCVIQMNILCLYMINHKNLWIYLLLPKLK